MSTVIGAALPLLPPQSFAQGPLERRVASTKDSDFLMRVLASAAFLPVTERSVWTQSAQPAIGSRDSRNGSELAEGSGGGCGASSDAGGQDAAYTAEKPSSPAPPPPLPPQLLWLSAADVQQTLSLCLEDGLLCADSDSHESWAVTPYLLGRESDECLRFALPLPSDRLATLQQATDSKGWRREDLRKLMSVLPAGELAVAGHAVALASWHELNAFCSRCGGPTAPIEAGAKRQCTREPRHRVYPRTDPVAIMMVESADGQYALLGRSRGHRPGMLTCLSGFIDQSESIEEAVRREVMEEAGISIGPIAIVGSQPWPIGRGGSCELMIGCVAQALPGALRVDPDEMEDVRWVPREVVAQAVEASAAGDHLANYQGADESQSDIGFWLPPPYAIAHNLIREWVRRDRSWFASRL